MARQLNEVYREMKRSCYSEKELLYRNYGGKEIKMCDEWINDRNTFYSWAKDNGFKTGLTVRREDTSKNFSPDNCYVTTPMKFTIRTDEEKEEIKRASEIKRMNAIRYDGVKKTKHPLFRTHVTMRTRCYNKNHENYKNYGGRGICVCDEWLGKNGFDNFYNWAKENGWKDKLTIDRIDTNGNYEPSNCKWSTIREQSRNKRNNVWVVYHGETMIISDYIKLTGLSLCLVRQNIKEQYMNVDNFENFIPKKKTRTIK